MCTSAAGGFSPTNWGRIRHRRPRRSIAGSSSRPLQASSTYRLPARSMSLISRRPGRHRAENWVWVVAALAVAAAGVAAHLRHQGRRVAHDGRRELDRRPGPLRFDRKHRPGRSATGRDHFGRRVSVGRQPRRPQRDACRRLLRAGRSYDLCGEGSDGVGRHENRSLGRRRDGWRFQYRPKLRPARLHAPPGDARSGLLLVRGVDA